MHYAVNNMLQVFDAADSWCASGALGVLEMLKEHGARMAATCSAGKTALHYASINSASDQVVRLLLQVREVKDAVSLPDEKGWTVLHYAVMHGNTGIVELLLQVRLLGSGAACFAGLVANFEVAGANDV